MRIDGDVFGGVAMTESTQDRWEKARQGVLARWRQILNRIDAHDEPGVLALANVMDEFCEEAMLSREASAGGRSDASGPLPKISTSGAPTGSRCLFCRGFLDIGGCFGLLDDLNQAVMKGRWDRAHSVAETYLQRLETMNLTSATGERVN
jgi:hypothetical protein